MAEPLGTLTSGLGYRLAPTLGAHRGVRSSPIELWAIKGTLQVEGASEPHLLSVGILLTHLHPVLLGIRTLPLLVAHTSVSDYPRGLCFTQEQFFPLIPHFSTLAEDKLNFNLPCGFGGNVRHPLTFLQSLLRLGSSIWAERYKSSMAVQVPWRRDDRLRLELIPDTPPFWWRVHLGANEQTQVMCYPVCQARGVVRMHSADLPVHGELMLEQVLVPRNPLSVCRNLSWLTVELPDRRRVYVYALTDTRGLKVTPQAVLCHPDGRVQTTEDVILQPMDVWRSVQDEKQYYVTRWRVSIPSFALEAEASASVATQEVAGGCGLYPFYLGGMHAEGQYNGVNFSVPAYTMQVYRDTDHLLLWLAGK